MDRDVPVTTILAAYGRATNTATVKTVVADGTLSGQGLHGTFHLVRDGLNEREDDALGPQSESSLRLGDRLFARNATGAVRELRGFLYRQGLTEEFIASGAFLSHPETVHFVGWGANGNAHVWKIAVRAPGGEPETLWIDAQSGLPLRLEYLDTDGSSFVTYSDWRAVRGHVFAFRSVQSDGDARFDTVQQTTSLVVDGHVDPGAFAPLEARALIEGGVHTVPLVERGGHVGVAVTVAGREWFFLLDTGAQGIVVDPQVLAAAAIVPQGHLEVLGATRSSGLGVATLSSLAVGDATLREVGVAALDLQSATSGRLAFDGILGYPFFASAVVELDFAHGLARFGPSGSFVPRGERIALDVDRELPEATLTANGVSAPFIIDTGNSAELFLYRPFVEAHPGIVPFSKTNSKTFGIGGTNDTYRTTLDVLDIGSTPLYHRSIDVILATSGAFADRIDAGNVGLGVLRNFVVTFDLGANAMYVAPGAHFDDRKDRDHVPWSSGNTSAVRPSCAAATVGVEARSHAHDRRHDTYDGSRTNRPPCAF
jgi:hypothetical protein